eukprot:320394-Prorocentrum_minimum.AAC.1
MKWYSYDYPCLGSGGALTEALGGVFGGPSHDCGVDHEHVVHVDEEGDLLLAAHLEQVPNPLLDPL